MFAEYIYSCQAIHAQVFCLTSLHASDWFRSARFWSIDADFYMVRSSSDKLSCVWLAHVSMFCAIDVVFWLLGLIFCFLQTNCITNYGTTHELRIQDLTTRSTRYALLLQRCDVLFTRRMIWKKYRSLKCSFGLHALQSQVLRFRQCFLHEVGSIQFYTCCLHEVGSVQFYTWCLLAGSGLEGLWPDSESNLLDLVYAVYLLVSLFRWLNSGHAGNLLEHTFGILVWCFFLVSKGVSYMLDYYACFKKWRIN
jgi:hypothetical protein